MNSDAISGVLLVDKPSGPTSHAVVAWLRKLSGQRSVGHCGTLDPAASGLLVVCLGSSTRLAEYFSKADKCYDATFILGSTTDTDDAQGRIVTKTAVHEQAMVSAASTLTGMVGPLDLAPPAYSAIRVNGKRSFHRARMGEIIELPRRRMNLHRLDNVRVIVRDNERMEISARLWVSKGSYIRSIAHELGSRLGVGGHLGSLRRIGSAHLTLDDSRVLSVGAQFDSSFLPPRWILNRDSRSAPDSKPTMNSDCYGDEAPHVIALNNLSEWLILPWQSLPFPHLQCDSPELDAIFRRLELGQRISGQGPEAATLFRKIAQNTPRFSLIQGSGDRQSNSNLIVVRYEMDKGGYPRFAPERVIRRF